jgi:hypothetical protein
MSIRLEGSDRMDHSQLWDLEDKGWRALCDQRATEFFRTALTDDVLIVVPGMVIDREMFLQNADSDPWASYHIDDRHTMQVTSDCVVLTYHVTASRPEGLPYTAWLTSAWVRRGGTWKMALHQQTPDPPAGG